MNISPDGVAITKRFFECFDILKAHKKIRGVATFAREFNINRWNLITVKNKPETSVLKPEWIHYMCSEYGINPEWIISGKGNVFK